MIHHRSFRGPGPLMFTLAVLGLVLVLAALALHDGLASWQWPPMHIVIDGEDISGSFGFDTLSGDQQATVALAVLLGLLVALVVVPLTLLLLALFLAVVLVLALGLPLLAVTAVAALMLSPLLLLGLLVWWALRPSRRPAGSATMAG